MVMPLLKTSFYLLEVTLGLQRRRIPTIPREQGLFRCVRWYARFGPVCFAVKVKEGENLTPIGSSERASGKDLCTLSLNTL